MKRKSFCVICNLFELDVKSLRYTLGANGAKSFVLDEVWDGLPKDMSQLTPLPQGPTNEKKAILSMSPSFIIPVFGIYVLCKKHRSVQPSDVFLRSV